MNNQLLPCPFCNSSPVPGVKWAQCSNSACPAFHIHTTNLEAWNRRATQPAAGERKPIAYVNYAANGQPYLDWLPGGEDESHALFGAPPAAAPVATGEPVAWIVESPEGCERVKSVCDSKLLADRYESLGWAVTPVFAAPPAAPPAAAHGDEAVRFERADVVAVLRDDLLAMSGDVDPSTGRSEMECLLASWLKGHDIPVFRKTLYAMRAQGDGD